MRQPKTALVVSRPVVLGLAALLWSGCGLPEDANVAEASALQVQTASLSGLCAPAPAAQTTYGSIVYYRYSTNRTWAAAKADCEAMGGRLAVPLNPTSNGAIHSIIGSDLTHIGVFQPDGQSSPSAGWLNTAGQPALYTNWSSGEPNDNGGASGEDNFQNCARMYTTGYWDDVACSQSNHYVCEFPSNPNTCMGGGTCSLYTDNTYRCL